MSQEQKQQTKQQEHTGWNWEVNHDGVIWSWSHPTPVYSLPVSATPVSSAPVSSAPVSSAPVSSAPVTKKTLVDYWYTVHDGVVIPTGTGDL
jgi:hypothetical protein